MMKNDKDLKVSDVQPAYERKYTVEEYHTWDEGFRAELHEGTLIVMEQPTTRHQGILMELAAQIHTYLRGKQCKVYPAPFGVRLSMDEESIFEPDIVVVCDKSIITKRGCIGAPDMVIEILSPSTARYDKKYKYNKYQAAGVREYWIIDPDINQLHVNLLKDGSYIGKMYDEKDTTVPVSILEGFEIDLTDIFIDGEDE